MLLDRTNMIAMGLNAGFSPWSLKNATGKSIAGTNAWTSGAVFGKTGLGFKHAYHNNLRGQGVLLAGMTAFSVAVAPRHHALSSGARSLANTVGSLVGGTLFGLGGQVVGSQIADNTAGVGIEKTVQALADLGAQVGKVNMGGNFQDSESAWTMRQQAVQQMSTSMLNARRYLGAEASFMHS